MQNIRLDVLRAKSIPGLKYHIITKLSLSLGYQNLLINNFIELSNNNCVSVYQGLKDRKRG